MESAGIAIDRTMRTIREWPRPETSTSGSETGKIYS